MAYVLAVVLIGLAIFAVVMLTRKKDDTSLSDQQKCEIAIQSTTKRNSEIVSTYSKSSATPSSSVNSFALNAEGGTGDLMNKYAMILSRNFILPYYVEYIMNSTKTDIYQNSFEVGKVYYAIPEGREPIYVLVKVNGDKTYLSMTSEATHSAELLKVLWTSVIDYDYTNNTLRSIHNVIMYGSTGFIANIDYVNNNAQLLYLTNMSDINLDELSQGVFNYDKYTITERSAASDFAISSNITNNINNVIVTSVPVTSDGNAKPLFNEITRMANYPTEYMAIDRSNAVLNTAISDAGEYSDARTDIRISEDGVTRTFYCSFVDYDTAVAAITSLVTQATQEDPYYVVLSNLKSRGKAGYTGTQHTYTVNGKDMQVSFTRVGNNMYELTATYDRDGATTTDTLNMTIKNGRFERVQNN